MCIRDRYVAKKELTLASKVNEKAPSDQLLGDVHGYIALEVWKEIPAIAKATGGSFKISNVLRELYLNQDNSLASNGSKRKSYLDYIEQVSKKSGTELKPFILKRALAFARPWFAKYAKQESSGFGRKTWFGAFTLEGALNEWISEFERLHAIHVKNAKSKEQLAKIVDDFIESLGDEVK